MNYSFSFLTITFFLLSLWYPENLISQKLKHYDNKCFVLNDTLYIAAASKKHPDRIQLIAAGNRGKSRVIFPPEDISYQKSFYDGLAWAIGYKYFFFEDRTRIGMQAEQLSRAIFFFKRKDLNALHALDYPEPPSTILSTRHFIFNLIDYQKRKGGLYNFSEVATNQNDDVFYLVNTSVGIQIGIHKGDYWKKANFRDIYEKEEQDQWKILGVMDFEIRRAFRAFILEDEVYVLSSDGIFKAPLSDLTAGHKIVDLTVKSHHQPLWIIDLDRKTVFMRHVTALHMLEKDEVKFVPLSEAPAMEKWVNQLCRKK